MLSTDTDPHAEARPPALRPRLIYVMNQLNLMVRKTLDERLKPFQLGSLQYTILTRIRDRDGISSAELSRRFFVTPQTMNEAVAALEQRGLIQRSESETNRRVLRARVTAEGLKLLKRCDAIADGIEAEVFGTLSEVDQRHLHAMLQAQLLRLERRNAE